MQFVLAVCLIGLAIFGVASFMDSYATAKQAQATIEVAQVAQVNALGNLVVILLLALVILLVAGVIVWMVFKRSTVSQRARTMIDQRSHETASLPMPQMDLNSLVQLAMLQLLKKMMGDATSPPTPLLKERGDESMDDLHWLRSG